ncbi:McrC family protein, partial [Helicobacter sp. MIT 01-3238]|uniref:McrC family protein n=1 Tax=Helicobacter sp. MIT 01-3238 TaxID=398627 RepID=UPI000E38C1E0
MSKNNTLCIAEWQSFGEKQIREVIADTRKDKAKDIFNEFVEFTKQEGNDKFLKFKNSTTLKAQNYVGLIQTKSGFCLEILPKTFRTAKDSEGFAIKNCVCSSQKSTHPLT